MKKSSNAFVIGFLNGFMPCASLAAMQLYAMSTASPVIGGVSMLLRGLSALNVNVSLSGTELSRYTVADIGESKQTVTVNLTYSSYGDIAVKKDVPVSFVIHAEENYITGCNGVDMSIDFGFRTQLKKVYYAGGSGKRRFNFKVGSV